MRGQGGGVDRKRIDLAQHHAGLDRAVPVVHLEPHGRVEHVLVVDAEAGAAEGDAEGAVRSRCGGCNVPAFPSSPIVPYVGHSCRRHHQPHAGVAHAERRQLAQLFGQFEPEPLTPPTIASIRSVRFRSSALRTASAWAAKAARNASRSPGAQRQPGRGLVAAEGLEVLGARLERRVQIEAGDAAPRAAPSPLAVERDDDDGTVVALDQPRGDDADHARVPALTREHQPVGFLHLVGELAPRRFGGRVDLPLGRPALRIRAPELFGDLLRPLLVVGKQQLDPCIRPIEPPGRVDPRGEPEPGVSLVERSDRISRPPSAPAARARLVLRISAIPRFTRERFSPINGTTSATVASATRSRSLAAASSGAAVPEASCPWSRDGRPLSQARYASFHATAVPQREANG